MFFGPHTTRTCGERGRGGGRKGRQTKTLARETAPDPAHVSAPTVHSRYAWGGLAKLSIPSTIVDEKHTLTLLVDEVVQHTEKLQVPNHGGPAATLGAFEHAVFQTSYVPELESRTGTNASESIASSDGSNRGGCFVCGVSSWFTTSGRFIQRLRRTWSPLLVGFRIVVCLGVFVVIPWFCSTTLLSNQSDDEEDVTCLRDRLTVDGMPRRTMSTRPPSPLCSLPLYLTTQPFR